MGSMTQTVRLGGDGRSTTRLGYGCSSLMGALGKRESLGLLEAAFDAGIRHYDVAPMYGFGAAEDCLGEFAAKHPGEITITTKYGIPPARHSSALGLARKLVGPVVRLLPQVKQRLARAAASMAAPAERATFTADQARESLERSLRALRVERIDVWLLHEVEAADLADDGLLRFLEDSVAAGKIGAFGAGSERHKVDLLLAEHPQYCRVLQFEWSVFDAAVTLPGVFRIHHRALTDNFRLLHERLRGDVPRCRQWSEATGVDLADREMLANIMLKAALVQNPESIVLVSSKNPVHIQKNVAVAVDEKMQEPARRFYELVQQNVHHNFTVGASA